MTEKKLIRPSPQELEEMIDKHERYSVAKNGGKRANFAYYDLSDMSILKRNLSDADFSGASLHNTDLRWCKLDRAIMFCADLRNANLQNASLIRADLRGASLRGSNLVNTDMTGVDQDEVGVSRAVRRRIAQGRERLGHTLAVIHVHLTAICLDVHPLWRGRFRGLCVAGHPSADSNGTP